MRYLWLAILGSAAVADGTDLAPQGAWSWHPGAENCTAETTRTEIRALDARTYVLRQNPCVDYEANLVYLLLGSQRMLLIDTGAVEDAAAAPLVREVQRIRQETGGNLPLLVVHTHGHFDHRAGDAAFAALPDVQIAPHEGEAMRQFFGFDSGPRPLARLELGDRELQVLPAPGHHEDHVVFYDPRTGVLFTGDLLLPGRLLVDDLAAYRASARRIADFVSQHDVAALMGSHIELDSAGNLFPSGATYHPDERRTPLAAQDARDLVAALDGFNGFYSAHRNFVVVDPLHNLMALAAGIAVVLSALGWLLRRWWKRRRRVRGGNADT